MFGINNDSEIEIMEPPPKGGGLFRKLKCRKGEIYEYR